MPVLQDDQLYRALTARDARFDGVFFVGVTSTRIYCRPVCTAPKPRPERCRYFASAAAAERRGFRPCLRCRPELSPNVAPLATIASVDAVGRLARHAAGLIAAGALDREGLDKLAEGLCVSTRHLRRAVERELGATPVELAQTRRLLTAKQLLTETSLSVSRVALASGFRSVRRFNALFSARYRLSPSALRRDAGAAENGVGHRPPMSTTTDGIAPVTVRLTLAFRPPFDWADMLSYLSLRATPGVELVTSHDGGRYWRSVMLQGHQGFIAVAQPASRRSRKAPAQDRVSGKTSSRTRTDTLELELSASLLPVLVPLLARLRRLFDLDAEPQAIAGHLAEDPALEPLVARRPGLRVPGAFDGFELALRTVLGQQVSVRGATTLAGRLALLGDELASASSRLGGVVPPTPLTRLPVTAEQLADAHVSSLTGIGLPRARAECIVALARAVAGGELSELANDTPGGDPASFMRRFTELPGIGPWTAEYVVMRALRWPDAFPHGDLGLRKAMGGLSPARLRAAAEPWRPWRAYAAQHLWASLGDVGDERSSGARE